MLRSHAMRQALFVLLTAAFLTLAWTSYDNVWSDLEPTRALADAAVCKVKDCKKPHGVTKITRQPNGQTFEYTWEDGVVTVACHRESYVFGPVQCQAP